MDPAGSWPVAAPVGGTVYCLARQNSSEGISLEAGMTAVAIDHVNLAVPSARLPEMLDFYTRIVGLREGERPALPFPGHFLYCDQSPIAVLHLATYKEDELELPQPTGRFNHVCFRKTGLAQTRERLAASSHPFREQDRPTSPVVQIFVTDPAGVTVELTFDKAAEGIDRPVPSGGG
jgi:catechol 2,3-dioxygenase-like lactoylglutathione lyase family enzyme